MHIERITHTGSMQVLGELTGSERMLRVGGPFFTVRIDPAECEDMPEAWVEPLLSDVVVETLVDEYRKWLISLR